MPETVPDVKTPPPKYSCFPYSPSPCPQIRESRTCLFNILSICKPPTSRLPPARLSMPERRHCILWIRPRMAKYFQAEMKTVYLLGRDRLSRTINSQTAAYKQSSIVLQNTVYVNENKIMRRNTKKNVPIYCLCRCKSIHLQR